jgi:hypothetical protein
VKRLAYLVAFALLACGGGSGESPPAPPVADRTDLLFGYFGDCDTCVGETLHANVQFINGWGAPGAIRRHAIEAVNADQKIILAACWFCPAGQLEALFDQLRQDGTLSSVVALYPQDEPDVAGMSADQVAAMIATVRIASSKFHELAGVPIAAIYGSKGTEGIEYFDWIGRDNYGTGPIVPIRQANQRLILTPGGANPWRENPAAFIDMANRTPAVVAIVAFLWRWPSPGHDLAIAENGMAPIYCAAALRLTRRGETC